MSSCFGSRKGNSSDRQPLLPQYEDDTVLQRELHQKLHSYQMLRALSKGFLPSTEQTIVNLRTILASDVLNAENPDLSDSGRRLVRYSRQWIMQFIDLLRHKNDGDLLQDAIWFLTKSRVSFDVGDVTRRARNTKAKADAAATYESFRTVGSLLLTNSDFRIFLNDLNIVGREVFRDSAFALSHVAEEAGKKVEPSQEQQKALTQEGDDGKDGAPTAKQLGGEAVDVGAVVVDGAKEVAVTAKDTASDKLSGEEGKTLINRLKQTVLKLRQRNDYSDSVSTLTRLLQRYAMIYSRAAMDISEVAGQDTRQNEAVDRACHNIWKLITRFGDSKAWEECERLFKKVVSHRDNDPQFENTMRDVGNSIQKLLTDPDFLDSAQEKFQQLRAKAQKSDSGNSLNDDVRAFLHQVELTLHSVMQDTDINALLTTSFRLLSVLSPTGALTNTDLIQDAINIFIPLLITAIQYIPIPRLEISTPDIDLLLENLIIEPGKTVNHTSFLPYRLKIETYNDLSIQAGRFRTTSNSKNLMTIKLDGLSARADEVGFWLRAHSGILRLADQGLAGFALDEKGLDIHIDLEICKDRLEQVLSLRDVRVHIHKLSFTLRKSRFSFFGWLFKPLLRLLLRKTLEKQLASAVADFFHAANRELLYARERLRATRVADPADLWTFVRAIAARLTPRDDPDADVRLGVEQPGKGVFKNVYAPGSIVKLWHKEALEAAERVEDFEAEGWRNEIFDTHVATMG